MYTDMYTELVSHLIWCSSNSGVGFKDFLWTRKKPFLFDRPVAERGRSSGGNTL